LSQPDRAASFKANMPSTGGPSLSLSEHQTLVRTRLALERTLMAWLRTGISLITFGFAIFKAFSFAYEHALVVRRGFLSPREFALVMISLGILSMAIATYQHYRHVRMLRELDHDLPVASVSIFTAGLLSLLGVLALVSAIVRQ
jgi:putative membrane protein